MIGTAIAAGVAAAASLAGGISKANAARRARNQQNSAIKSLMADNAAWYSRKINQDFLERAENQSALERARAAYQSTIMMAQGRQDMLGGSNASSAATKEAAAKGMADASSQIAANASQSKDAAEESYRAMDLSLQQKKMDLDAQEAAAKSDAIEVAANAIGSAASSYASGLGSTGTGTGTATASAAGAAKASNEASKSVEQSVADNVKKTSDIASDFKSASATSAPTIGATMESMRASNANTTSKLSVDPEDPGDFLSRWKQRKNQNLYK